MGSRSETILTPPNSKIRFTGDKLQQLPVEIIEMILDCCTFRAFLTLSETSRYWNDFIKNSKRFKNEAQLVICGYNCDEVIDCSQQFSNIKIVIYLNEEYITPILEKFAPHIQSLDIPHKLMIDKHFPKLKYLKMDRRGSHNEITVLQIMSVHALQLEYIQMLVANSSEMKYMINSLPKLRVLDVYHSFYPFEGEKFNEEESFKKVNESITALNAIAYIPCILPNLKILSLKILNYDTIRRCFEQMHKLEVVLFVMLIVDDKEHLELERFKQVLLRFKNYDFDKENKRNVRFYKKYDSRDIWHRYTNQRMLY
jgi:hypothetical protein